MNKFEQLGLSESLLKAILDLGFENPTEVQEKAIPHYWKKTDMVAWAQRDRKTAALDFQLFRKLMPTTENTSINFISNTRTLFADYQRN
jgi:ATP-dependent RNA helicase DeaD